MCRKVCQRARRMGENEDPKALREMVQLLKELSALMRDLEGTTGRESAVIRLEQEVEQFAE